MGLARNQAASLREATSTMMMFGSTATQTTTTATAAIPSSSSDNNNNTTPSTTTIFAASPSSSSVLDECEEVVCSSKSDMFRRSVLGGFGRGKKGTGKEKMGGGKKNDGGGGQATGDDTKDLVTSSRLACPPDRDQVGRAGWSLLHTTAAYYPKKPTLQQRNAAKDLVNGVAVLYPCVHCREHFQETIKESPPRVESRDAFSM